jgi:hypothetical protein
LPGLIKGCARMLTGTPKAMTRPIALQSLRWLRRRKQRLNAVKAGQLPKPGR